MPAGGPVGVPGGGPVGVPGGGPKTVGTEPDVGIVNPGGRNCLMISSISAADGGPVRPIVSSVGMPAGGPVGMPAGGPVCDGGPVGTPAGGPVGAPAGGPVGTPAGGPVGTLDGTVDMGALPNAPTSGGFVNAVNVGAAAAPGDVWYGWNPPFVVSAAIFAMSVACTPVGSVDGAVFAISGVTTVGGVGAFAGSNLIVGGRDGCDASFTPAMV